MRMALEARKRLYRIPLRQVYKVTCRIDRASLTFRDIRQGRTNPKWGVTASLPVVIFKDSPNSRFHRLLLLRPPRTKNLSPLEI